MTDYTNPTRAALSVAEAAKALGVHRATIWRMERDGQITTVKIRGRRLVPVAEIVRLTAPAAPAPAPTSTEAPAPVKKRRLVAPPPVSEAHAHLWRRRRRTA